MPGTPVFGGSPPVSPPGFGARGGGISDGEEPATPLAAVAPRPPCNTPGRPALPEPEVFDELAVASSAASAGIDTGNGHMGSPPRFNAVGVRERYRILKKIGTGCFGTVHLAEAVASGGQQVAVKCVSSDYGREVREAELLKQIQHPCIVPLIDQFDAPGPDGKRSLHIVMEYLPGNLHLQIDGRPLEPTAFRCLAFQLLRALAHLDGMRICHRDVKPENVLLGSPTSSSASSDAANSCATFTLKLADFGSAKKLDTGPSNSYICARWWRAPELVLGHSAYSTSVDWWSCGCVFAEMMLGRPLFAGDSNWGQMVEIVRVLGPPSTQELRVLDPGGNESLTERLAGLVAAEARRQARPWATLLPAYAGVPEALEVLARLLAYDPATRWSPAKALTCRLFDALPAEFGALHPHIFDLTEDEFRPCSPNLQQELRDVANRHRRSPAPKGVNVDCG